MLQYRVAKLLTGGGKSEGIVRHAVEWTSVRYDLVRIAD